MVAKVFYGLGTFLCLMGGVDFHVQHFLIGWFGLAAYGIGFIVEPA